MKNRTISIIFFMAVLSLIGCGGSETTVTTAEAVASEYCAQDVSAETLNGSTQDHNADSVTAALV